MGGAGRGMPALAVLRGIMGGSLLPARLTCVPARPWPVPWPAEAGLHPSACHVGVRASASILGTWDLWQGASGPDCTEPLVLRRQEAQWLGPQAPARGLQCRPPTPCRVPLPACCRATLEDSRLPGLH